MNQPAPTQPALLARGPVATVYAAFVDGKHVAWKVFPTKFDRRTLAAVERDRAKLSALRAPILPVDEVERWDGQHALRMELCTESLTTRIQRIGPLPVADTVLLAHSLALALAAAHGAGVLHGAVNPDNVLFRASGEPVLADFGVPLREAFPRDPLHAIEFVSPETMRTSTVTGHTDLYGLGAVLHVCLTGRSPHPGRLGEQQGERVLRVLRSPVPAISRPDVPVSLATVVARLLAAEVGNRPSDAASVAKRFADMLPERPADGALPLQRNDYLSPPVPTKPPRRRQLATAGIGLFVLALAAVLILLLHNNSTPQAAPAAPAVDLAIPQDFTDHVVLNWTTGRPLNFFVVVVKTDGQPNKYPVAGRNHTITVPVDPARKYCFLVRGTDESANQVYESRPAAVRGANCQR
jgi:serine/threonine protein kinase